MSPIFFVIPKPDHRGLWTNIVCRCTNIYACIILRFWLHRLWRSVPHTLLPPAYLVFLFFLSLFSHSLYSFLSFFWSSLLFLDRSLVNRFNLPPPLRAKLFFPYKTSWHISLAPPFSPAYFFLSFSPSLSPSFSLSLTSFLTIH